MLILLLDDIKIINFLHAYFFSIVIIIFIGLLFLFSKKIKLKKLLQIKNLYPKNRANNKKIILNIEK